MDTHSNHLGLRRRRTSPQCRVQAAEELIPSLLLGIGKCSFDTGDFESAISTFDELLQQHPGSEVAAEAIYYRGVALYKHTEEPKNLKDAYEKLAAEYADSVWAKRAYPYRLI